MSKKHNFGNDEYSGDEQGEYDENQAGQSDAPVLAIAGGVAEDTTPKNADCRMYQERYPEVDDLVMVNVQQIAEMGAYVRLLEYNNTEGMILLSELSRRRIRSIQKHIRVGKNEVVVVLRVDKEKGYIDLSKRKVSPEDIAKCEEKFTKSKQVHSIMSHVAERTGEPLEHLYENIAWPIYKRFGHAYDAFKLAINEPDKVFEGITMNDNIRQELLHNIKRRLTPQATKIRSDIEVTCFGYEGIDAIKAALHAGEGCSTETVPIKIQLVAPPLYVMTTNSLDKVQGVVVMEKAILRIEEVIKSHMGNLTVKMKPRAVSENDELELEKMIDEADRANRDVSGDEDSDGSEGDE